MVGAAGAPPPRPPVAGAPPPPAALRRRCAARCGPATRAPASGEHQEMNARSNAVCGRRRLHRLHRHAKHSWVELGARRGDREVTHVLHREQPLGRRRLRLAHVAEGSAAPAVTHIVQLEHDAGRIAHEHLARAAARHHADLHRSDPRTRGTRAILGRDAMLRKNLEDVVDVELLDPHAEAADARPLARPRGHNGEKPGTGADSQVVVVPCRA